MNQTNVYSEKAEDQFKLMCTESQVTCTKPDRDLNAWDFFIEIPAREHENMLPDKKPGMKEAFVQIKSTTRDKPITKIKVSNAIKLAQREIPCFIVLFQYSNSESPIIYVTHFWKEMITRSLTLARKLALNSKQLHQHSIQITFRAVEEHTYDLISWISDLVRNFPDDYVTKKQHYFQHIGYEGRNYTTKLSLVLPRGYEDLVDVQLGLIENLETNKVIIFDRRFDLDNPKPLQEFDSGNIKFEPSEPLKVILTLQANNERAVRLDGEVRIPYVPSLPDEYFKIAIHTRIFSLVLSYTCLQVIFQLEEKLIVPDLRELAKILSWGGENLRVVVRGEKFTDLDDVFPFPIIGSKKLVMQLSTVCDGLSIINDFVHTNDLCYSWVDIAKELVSLYAFCILCSGTKLNIVGTPLDSMVGVNNVESFSFSAGYLTFSIGGSHYYVIYKIQIENIVSEQGNISMIWGERNIRDAFVGRDEEQTRLEGNEKFLNLQRSSLNDCLIFGNLNLLLQDFAHERT